MPPPMPHRPNNPRDYPPQMAQVWEMLGHIVEELDAIVFIADLESSVILYANAYFKSRIGFDPTGRRCNQIFHGREPGCVFCNEEAELLGPDGTPCGVFTREYRNPFDKKWYAAKTQAIRWIDGRYARLETAQDITEQKRLQTFLEEARQQAEAAIATKSRFVSLVAHDLKSPFVSILGMLRRILDKETFAHEVHRTFLETIITNGQRMLRMIDNLLDMERLEEGMIKPEPTFFDLAEMVDEVFDNFSHLARHKGLLLTNRINRGAELYADRYLYFVVLNNLVSNAVKFSYEHGAITVALRRQGSEHLVEVRDKGPGVPEVYRADLFRPDVKTTCPGTSGETGSGLGLVFSQQIMKAHGGEILLEHDENGGAVFLIRLGASCRLPGRELDDLDIEQHR